MSARRLRQAAALAAVPLVLAAALALAGGRAQGQEAPPFEVQLTLAPPQVTLGDRLRLTVTVVHGEDLLLTAEPPARREAIELIESLPPETSTLADGRLRTEFGFTLAAFDLGEQAPGAVVLSWLRADGASGSEVLAVPPFEVRSALIGDGTDLRPLKPQLGFGDPPPPWVRPVSLGGALILFLLAAALVAWRWRRRRAVAPAPFAVTRTRPAEGPETAARRALEELATGGVLARGEFDRYYGTLSLVVREYLESRFAFSATALTTPELEARMTGEGIDRCGPARLAGGLLDRCDAAVYARRRPDPTSADHDLTVAFEIIELARRPRAEPAGARPNGDAP